MKRFLLINLFLLIALFAMAQADTGSQAEILFEKYKHNFRKIDADKPVVYRFRFKNVGSSPLLISKVKPSCGCTAANWTKQPILPDKKGYIEVIFDAKKAGKFFKTIQVFSNDESSPVELIIKGKVVWSKK